MLQSSLWGWLSRLPDSRASLTLAPPWWGFLTGEVLNSPAGARPSLTFVWQALNRGIHRWLCWHFQPLHSWGRKQWRDYCWDCPEREREREREKQTTQLCKDIIHALCFMNVGYENGFIHIFLRQISMTEANFHGHIFCGTFVYTCMFVYPACKFPFSMIEFSRDLFLTPSLYKANNSSVCMNFRGTFTLKHYLDERCRCAVRVA